MVIYELTIGQPQQKHFEEQKSRRKLKDHPNSVVKHLEGGSGRSGRCYANVNAKKKFYTNNSLKLKCHIDFCVARDDPLPEAGFILGTRHAAINGLTHISRRISAFLMNKDNPAH